MKLYTAALLMLLAFPVNAQVVPKAITVGCGPLQELVDYLNDDGYKMVMMGETFTPDVYDSLWINVLQDSYTYIRAVKTTGEGCIIASGSISYTEFPERI